MDRTENYTRIGLADALRNHPHPGCIIVNPELKFIYMKAPKVAGTSILRHVMEKSIPNIIHYKDHPVPFKVWLDTVTDEALAEY